MMNGRVTHDAGQLQTVAGLGLSGSPDGLVENAFNSLRERIWLGAIRATAMYSLSEGRCPWQLP